MDSNKARILRQGGPLRVAEWNDLRRGLKDHELGSPEFSPDLEEANYCGTVLDNVDLRMVDLRGADFTNASLREADLRGANLSGANLSRSHLSRANLRRANLNNADLMGADLRHAALDMAHLGKADLTGASLNYARLRSAVLTIANLQGVDLSRADLARANLDGANLVKAKFFETVLRGANLAGAILGYTLWCSTNLGTVEGLSGMRHEGPSSIGLDTVLKSGGKLPDRFLRGCGVDPHLQKIILGDNEALVEAAYATARPMQLQSCFISYSTKDKPFVDRLQAALNRRGVEYWYAPEHGRWGEKLTAQIDRAIAVRDRVLLVCSRASLNDSDWVQWEIERAFAEADRRGRELVFPITIDDAIFGWSHPRATRIRDLLVGSFVKATKGDAFQNRVDRLVDGLKKRPGGRP